MFPQLPLLQKIKVIGLIVACAAFVAAGAYILILRHNLSSTQEKLTTAQNLVKEKDAQLVDVTARANRAMLDLAKLGRDNADRVKAAKQREREIRNVPEDQDGAVAPVLLDSLERLR